MILNPDHLNYAISLLTQEQQKLITDGVRYTANYFSEAILIGGCAVVAYINDFRELTPDLDFLIDLEIVKDRFTLENIISNPLINSKGETIGLSNRGFTDYIDSKSGNKKLNDLIISECDTLHLMGHKLRIINPELLTILKLELSRNKDLNDAFLLVGSRCLSRNLYLKYLSVLRYDLSDYQSLLSYSKMLK